MNYYSSWVLSGLLTGQLPRDMARPVFVVIALWCAVFLVPLAARTNDDDCDTSIPNGLLMATRAKRGPGKGIVPGKSPQTEAGWGVFGLGFCMEDLCTRLGALGKKDAQLYIAYLLMIMQVLSVNRCACNLC